MSHVLDAVLAESWAIMPQALEAILQIVDRGLQAQRIDPAIFHGSGQTEERAVLAIRGERLEGARRAVLRERTAIIPVMGPIFPRSNLFTAYSGATSVDTLAQDLAVALESPQVDAIVLNIDSPGGAITGVSEFSDQVLRARESKPITAYVMGYAASAAYWIASAAGEVVTTDTGRLGSIGVYAAYLDTRVKDEKQGVKNIDIVSSQSPKKVPDPATPEGRQQVQALVDDLADVFISTVARNRGVAADTVLSDFGQGDVLVASKAITAGMADRLGSLEELLTGGTGNTPSPPFTERGFMQEQQQKEHAERAEVVGMMARGGNDRHCPAGHGDPADTDSGFGEGQPVPAASKPGTEDQERATVAAGIARGANRFYGTGQ